MAPYKDVTVKLVGEDGNAFSIIGSVGKELRRKHGDAVAKEWAEYAMGSDSYEQLLTRAQEIVNVI